MNTAKRFVKIVVIICLSQFIACAQKDKPQSKAHPASFVTETFAMDNGMPIREVQKQEFYFKKCELESRRPFASKVEFSCND